MPIQLQIVRAALEKMCQMIGFDDDTTGGIILSVDEALTNIIRHAYDGSDDKLIEVELAQLSENDGGLKICLRDYGKYVDRSKIKPRDLADVRPGGLGVHIMKEYMDSLDYQPGDGGGTLLTMTKKLQKQEAGSDQ